MTVPDQPQQQPSAPPVAAAQPPTPAPPRQVPPAAVLPPVGAATVRQPGGFRRGFGIGAGAGLGLGTALLVLSVVGSLLLALVGASMAAAYAQAQSGPQVTGLQTVWGSETAAAAQTVLAVPVIGAIQAEGSDGLTLTSATFGYEIARTLDALSADDYAGVVLLMDTPGGTINGSRAIADAVERYQARTGRKVVAFVQGMSASGGMYAMAGADRIIADHGTLVGSIGVIFGPFVRYRDVVGTSGSLVESGVSTRGGITQEYLTQGRGKDFGNPYRDMTQEERTVFTSGITVEYDAFVDWVARNRNIPAATIKSDLGAFIYDPRTAIAKGLVDAQLGPDEAFRDAVQLMGLDPATARVAKRQPAGLFAQLLGASARVYGYQQAPPSGPATSVICTGAPQPLVWHGPVVGICG